MTQNDIFNELITLRNELLGAKNLIDQSPEVKTSRRLQGTIARCTVLLSRLCPKREENVVQETDGQTAEESSNG